MLHDKPRVGTWPTPPLTWAGACARVRRCVGQISDADKQRPIATDNGYFSRGAPPAQDFGFGPEVFFGADHSTHHQRHIDSAQRVAIDDFADSIGPQWRKVTPAFSWLRLSAGALCVVNIFKSSSRSITFQMQCLDNSSKSCAERRRVARQRTRAHRAILRQAGSKLNKTVHSTA